MFLTKPLSKRLLLFLFGLAADDSDRELREMLAKTKHLARIRLEKDEVIFPLVYLDAFEWFYEDYMPAEKLFMWLNSLPDNMIEDLKEEKEEYAAGIMKFRKKYPLLYKTYKERWDGLFAELTEGLNREMRRELRKIK
jgi:hypothetical protein